MADMAIWCCPLCHGRLAFSEAAATCTSCGHVYEMVAGIPDLRVQGAAWIDFDEDIEKAKWLYRTSMSLTTEQTIERLYSSRPGWSLSLAQYRTRQVVEAAERLKEDVVGWLDFCTQGPRPFLDLGCGGGQLLAAAASQGRHGVGIDVSMEWLIVAQRLIADRGGKPVLAAAMAEALPLKTGAIEGVVSLDVIEHVGDMGAYLREIDRITSEKGVCALSTPNRYSLTSEPHIFVWGVGLMPRRWQKAYVKWRSGKAYDFTQLLSTWEACRLFRWNTSFEVRIVVPPIPVQEIAHFSKWKAALARLYNRMIKVPLVRSIFLLIGPFFRIVGLKRS